MQEAATSILIGRSQQADGLNRMVVWSLVVHSVLLLGIVLMPRDWLRVAKEQEAAPMMISLGPAGQADTGGMTAITSAPVQRVAEPEAKPVNTPPAPKAPEMTVPEPDVKPKPVLKPVDKPIDKSAAKKPTTGPEIEVGAARVVIGERGAGSVRRARRSDRRQRHRRRAHRRRQLLLSRVHRQHDAADPIELGSAPGRVRTVGHPIHHTPRRHADERRGR